jgi:hypothetical protein
MEFVKGKKRNEAGRKKNKRNGISSQDEGISGWESVGRVIIRTGDVEINQSLIPKDLMQNGRGERVRCC